MTLQTPIVNPTSVAPLKNVASMLTLIDTLKNRPQTSSGFGVYSGPSGFGKTVASTYAQNATGCLYIEVREFWTKKSFCEALLAELGVPAKGTIAQMMKDITFRLGARTGQCVIVDEADKLVDKSMIELARDVQEMTNAAMILVGEERLPQKLEAVERVHNRVLDWTLAQPCDLADARVLARLIAPGVKVSDELLEEICRQTSGRTRRVANSLFEVANWAVNAGHEGLLTKTDYTGRIFTGQAPVRGRG